MKEYNWWELLRQQPLVDRIQTHIDKVMDINADLAKQVAELRQEVQLLEEDDTFVKEGFPVPKITRSTDGIIRNKIIKHCKKFEVLDAQYDTITLAALKKWLAWNTISHKKWTEEQYDCDNFALELWSEFKEWMPRGSLGIATVTLKGYRHAINIFIDSRSNVYFIEPQSDTCYKNTFPGLVSVDNILI